jgi:hypothetical protein
MSARSGGAPGVEPSDNYLLLMRSATNEQLGAAGARNLTSRVRLHTDESRLVRLGVAYADSLRLTIITELYMREMSAKQFFEEVGGPSFDSVRKHFARLAEYGWLRKVRKRSDGLGRPQDVYRATELAIVDDETWAEIPVSIRDAFTLQLMQQLSERVGLSLEAQRLTARDEVLSLVSPLLLDDLGWKEVLMVLKHCFDSLEQEQTDAKTRIQIHEEPPILMTVALAAFELPHLSASRKSASELPFPSASALDTQVPWTIRLAKVFGDPVSLKIVWALNDAPMSPSALHKLIGGATVQTFDRKCKNLTNLGWLTEVDRQTGGHRRGAQEVFYRATAPMASGEQIWASISPSLRSGEVWSTYQEFCLAAFEGVRHGTFNARTDRHLTWWTLVLDEIGWTQGAKALRACVQSISSIARAAEGRLLKDSARGAPFTSFVWGFESPPLDGLPTWGDSGAAS